VGGKANDSTKKSILLGSPVHQKPEILKEFLEGLSCLRQETVCLDYFFYDDNDDPESSDLLMQFSAHFSNTCIKSSKEQAAYTCNENTHFWSDELIWKVAGFKDEMIGYALERNYDALFLVDSDILLEPSVVEQLAAADRDIVSEVFWTCWYPGSQALPNVWHYDHYDMVPRSRKEKLSDAESAARQQQFLDMLKSPGLYEVGMLGACTLISRKAMEAGISFRPVNNLTLWGEDRHFCVRAAALGYKMYADTHCKTFHIYRMSELQEVEAFKREAGLDSPPLRLVLYRGVSCPVCEGDTVSLFHDFGSYKLLRCEACGLLFQASARTTDIAGLISSTYGPSWIQMRDQYLQDTFLGHAKFNNLLLEIFSPAKGRLLEIGSGTGEFLFMAREAGWEVTGFEPGADACRYAKDKFGLDLQCRVWDGADPAGQVPSVAGDDRGYDAVAFWHVLEHIAEPTPFLKSAAARLKPDGLLFFSFPNNDSLTNQVYGSSSPLYLEADHLMHYNRHNLTLLLKKAGLEAVVMFTRQEYQGLEAVCKALTRESEMPFERVMGISARLQSEFKGFGPVCVARKDRKAGLFHTPKPYIPAP
jgi:2-polyprenyl-3-methyl-5-hydroxy-6-metoxy-1,4-benzoquinol methylase